MDEVGHCFNMGWAVGLLQENVMWFQTWLPQLNSKGLFGWGYLQVWLIFYPLELFMKFIRWEQSCSYSLDIEVSNRKISFGEKNLSPIAISLTMKISIKKITEAFVFTIHTAYE